MRRKQRRTSDEAAWELLEKGQTHTLVSTLASGEPLVRVLNGVVVDDWVLFHGAIAGEKNLALGRPAIVSVSEVIAQIPSYFTDPLRACPATCYYRSVQAKGTLLELDSSEQKAAMLGALMAKYQPEGGFTPFDPESSFYAKDLKGVRVIGVRIEEVTGKANVGQDKPGEVLEKVISGLWQRGQSGDLLAIERVVEASPAVLPDWLRLPSSLGVSGRLCLHPHRNLAEAHAALLAPEYWRTQVPSGEIVESIEQSSAWIGAVDDTGVLLGAARAVTDGTWVGSICDVVVRPDLRGQGLGPCMMKALLDHPRVKRVRHLRLGTRDRMRFYEQFGFRPKDAVPLGFPSVEMVRRRGELESSTAARP